MNKLKLIIVSTSVNDKWLVSTRTATSAGELVLLKNRLIVQVKIKENEKKMNAGIDTALTKRGIHC